MADIASVFGRHEFLIRRLHSLTGLVPVGGVPGRPFANQRGDFGHRRHLPAAGGPDPQPGTYTLEVVEWLFIFLPILFHGIIGMIIVARGKRNVAIYPYRENIRYTLQRWTGVITFAFILWHVFQTRGWINDAVVARPRDQAAGRRDLRMPKMPRGPVPRRCRWPPGWRRSTR